MSHEDWVAVWRVVSLLAQAFVLGGIFMFLYQYVITVTTLRVRLQAQGKRLVMPPNFDMVAYHVFFFLIIANNSAGLFQRLENGDPATFSLWPTPFLMLGMLYFLQKFYYRYLRILKESDDEALPQPS